MGNAEKLDAERGGSCLVAAEAQRALGATTKAKTVTAIFRLYFSYSALWLLSHSLRHEGCRNCVTS